MMGGGQLAFTCIGIDYNESLGQVSTLSLSLSLSLIISIGLTSLLSPDPN